ncbi:hypothetical protein Tco_0270560 [Tanacetum coccineum]
MQRGKPRVAWKVVCRPKDQGGLGIKPVKQWNEVLLIRKIWKIIENKYYLWAKWINVVRFKRKGTWDIDMERTDSWGWKTMFKIRDSVKEHVWYSIGNGKKTSMFYDKWCANGPLCKFINKRAIYDARIKDNVVIADMLIDNN